MSTYRTRQRTAEATRWFKNGDHPTDRVGKRELDVVALADEHPELFGPDEVGPIPDDAPTYERLEGAVVRFFRHPDVDGSETHSVCGWIWNSHGWLDTGDGGQTVCPGDWVIDEGVSGYRVMSNEEFEAVFEPVPECKRCDGCGQVATSDDAEPWTFWARLRPPSNLAVQLGLVRPVDCPECAGTGRAR